MRYSDKNIRTRNAAAKVIRSKAMTASIPANDITAAARTGVRMDTSEFEMSAYRLFSDNAFRV